MVTHQQIEKFSSFDATRQRKALPPQNTDKIAQPLLCKRELAAALAVSPRTVENWLAAKKIPHLRLSPRLTRFDLPKVLAALDRYEVREIGGRK
jgi:hypothetical protein